MQHTAGCAASLSMLNILQVARLCRKLYWVDITGNSGGAGIHDSGAHSSDIGLQVSHAVLRLYLFAIHCQTVCHLLVGCAHDANCTSCVARLIVWLCSQVQLSRATLSQLQKKAKDAGLDLLAQRR